MGTDRRLGDIHVRLRHLGVPLATGPIVEMNEDGMYVRAATPPLAQGTYLEVEAGSARGRIGAMVERWSAQGVRLVFASWNPQLFELMQRVAKAANQAPRPAARSQA